MTVRAIHILGMSGVPRPHLTSRWRGSHIVDEQHPDRCQREIESLLIYIFLDKILKDLYIFLDKTITDLVLVTALCTNHFARDIALGITCTVCN